MYLRYREWVMRLAFRFTRDRDSAFTVLQETFRYVAEKLPGFTLTCEFRTFLYPVVRNLALMECRRANRVFRLRERLASFPKTSGKEPDFADGDALETLLDVLSVEHREVVMLRYLEDFNMQEIAVALEIPVGTVKSRLHHALKLLRDSPRTRHCFFRPDQRMGNSVSPP